MTKDEKIKGIFERISKQIPEEWGKLNVEKMFSEMAIISYGKVLERCGVLSKNVEGSEIYKSMPESSRMDYIQSVVEEFDWKPTDVEILTFMKNVLKISDKITRDTFFELLTCIRDEGEEVFEEKYYS